MNVDQKFKYLILCIWGKTADVVPLIKQACVSKANSRQIAVLVMETDTSYKTNCSKWGMLYDSVWAHLALTCSRQYSIGMRYGFWQRVSLIGREGRGISLGVKHHNVSSSALLIFLMTWSTLSALKRNAKVVQSATPEIKVYYIPFV